MLLIDEFHRVCEPIRERHGGYLGRDEGDGRFIWFGWPTAAEDDATRAVRMSLECSHAIQALATDLAARLGVELAVRIGVHTGEIIVREAADAGRPSLLGAAANVAAKVQDQCPPGGVLISEATAALVADAFEVTSAGHLQIDGLEGRLELFEVEPGGHIQNEGRELIGRTVERSLLADRWRFVRGGGFAAVLITGEAGIGKSQLVSGFLASFAAGAERLALAADSYRQNETFGALVDGLRRSNLDLADDFADDLLDQERREVAIEILIDAIARRAAREPFVVVAEDLHWLDPSTSEFLARLAAAEPSSVMVLATSRLTAAALVEAPGVVTMGLGPLDAQELERLIDREGPGLSEADRRAIAHRSAGNPFFAQALVASQHGPEQTGTRRALLPHSEVPIVVQQALRGQLDRNPSAADLAITAAVIGREFTEDQLRRCHPDSPSFADDLRWLTEAGLVETSSAGLRFRHALVQQLAYDLPVRNDRRQRHSRVGDGLAELGAASSSVLAVHYDRAGRGTEAIGYLLDAGRVCRRAGAFREGLEELDRAVELMESADAPDRSDEIEILELRAVMAAAVGESSYGANPFDRQRLNSLLSEEDDPAALARALTRDWGSAMVMSDLQRGGGILRRLWKVSREDATTHAVARLFRGTHMMYRGNVRYAEPLLTRAALDLVELGLQPEFRANWSTADDPVSVGLSRLPALLWMRGNIDEAEAMLELANNEAATTAGPAAAMSMAHVKANAALFYEQAGDGHRAVELGAEIAAIGAEPSLEFWEQNGQLHQLIGGVLLEPTGDRLDKLAAAARMLESVARLFAPMLYLETARGHLRNQNHTAALAAVKGAVTIAKETRARWLWSETLRLEAAAAADDADSRRRERLVEAVATAWNQGSRVYLLRAAADLLEADAGAEHLISGLPHGDLTLGDLAGRALDDFPSLDRYDEVERLVSLLDS